MQPTESGPAQPINTPLPPPPRPQNTPEQEQAGGGSTSPLPPPPFTLRALLAWPFRRPYPNYLPTPAGPIAIDDTVVVLSGDGSILHEIRVTALWHDGTVVGRRLSDGEFREFEAREVVEVLP